MGWICPSCGNENQFQSKTCQVCGKTVGIFRLMAEKFASNREEKLWNKPFLEAEELFFNASTGFQEKIGKGFHSFAKTASSLMLLAMALCAAAFIAINSEVVLQRFPQLYSLTDAIQKRAAYAENNISSISKAVSEETETIGNRWNELLAQNEYHISGVQRSLNHIIGNMSQSGKMVSGKGMLLLNNLEMKGTLFSEHLAKAQTEFMVSFETSGKIQSSLDQMGANLIRNFDRLSDRINELRPESSSEIRDN